MISHNDYIAGIVVYRFLCVQLPVHGLSIYIYMYKYMYV